MLSHLIIRNFAIIDELEIGFSDGLTVITGETGAGKSIIINALNLVLGGRASTEVIRSQADVAVVEAIFELSDEAWARLAPVLEQQGIECDDQLIIKRTVARSGRNKVFVNGSATRVTALRALARGLIDISGQHEHYSLMDPARHVFFLDGFAGLEELRGRVEEAFGRLVELRREVERLQRGERQRLTQIDFLRFQLDEIDAAELDPEEEEALMTEVQRLRHAEQLREVARSATHRLYEDELAAVDTVADICRDLGRASSLDPELGTMREALESAHIQLAEVAADLRGYAEAIESDPRRLATIEVRLEKIERLGRKHGGDVQQILDRAGEMREELETLERTEERIDGAQRQVSILRKVVLAQARTLSQRRKEAARRLTELVESELGQLGMAGCRFEVIINHLDEEGQTTDDAARAGLQSLGATGIDHIEFAIAPNRGEEPRPMARIASGGELSRIMLAIKSGLLLTDPVESYVFDEIDSGIGGSIAEVVGRKIKEVARNRQVICITHLPQIASYGHHHMVVQKHQGPERTVSSVHQIDDPQKIVEIARMLGGVNITQKTLAHAEEMIAEATRYQPR